MNAVRKDSAVHVSLSSYLIVKQQSLVKQDIVWFTRNVWLTRQRAAPGTDSFSPAFSTGWFFRPEELERNDPRRPSKAALVTLPSL